MTEVVRELDRRVADYVAELGRRPARTLQQTKMAVNFQMRQIVWRAIEKVLDLLEPSDFSTNHRDLVGVFRARPSER